MTRGSVGVTMTSRKKKARKPRNWVAVAAMRRKGGHHGDARKQASRTACRRRGREEHE